MSTPSQDARTPAVCAFVQRTIMAAVNRVRVARWIGEQAVTYGRREVVKAVEAVARTANSTVPDDERTTTAVVPSDHLPAAGAQVPDVSVGVVTPARPTASAAHTNLDLDVTSRVAAAPVAAGVAPFDGYDTLPAAHIVQRLTRLTPVELAAVRAYELVHRGRRTVVAKVDQLLDAG